MSAETEPPKRQDNTISSLNMAIDILNIAKEVSSVTPAKAVFGSVSVLLVMIRVSSLLFCVFEFPIHMRLGFNDKPSGLCRTWTGLCRHLYCPQAGNGWKGIERPESARAQGDQAIEEVSEARNLCFSSPLSGLLL